MNIVQVTSEFPPQCGGVGYYVFYLSRELRKQGHGVEVILRGKKEAEYEYEGIAVKEIKVPGRPPFNMSIFRKKVEKILAQIKHDIVHMHTTSMPAIHNDGPLVVTAHWCMRAGVPVFHRPINDLEAFYKNIFLPFYESNTKKILRTCSRLTVVSNSLRDEFKKYYNVEADVVFNAVDIDRFSFVPMSKEDCILFVGTLRTGKGVLDLLEVSDRLKKSHANVTVCLAGRGPLFNRLQREMKKRRLENIKLLGSLSHQELVDYYNRARIFVLPTYYEGLPTTVLEAMACKLPVVASRVSGIPDLVEEGETGYLLSPGDVEGFHQKIAELLDDPEKQERFGVRGREKVTAKFTWPDIAQGIINKYQEVLRNYPTS